ncbi:MAG: DUF6798 domain-containing protein, partial [Armatimonadota bacterium]
AWLSHWLPLEPLEMVLFLMARGWLFYAVYRLAQAVVPGNRLAALGSMAAFALIPQPMFAEGTIMVNIFEQSSVAVPFVLLAVADFIERRYWRSALWLGIVANLTVLYAVYLAIYLLGIVLTVPDFRREWRALLAASVFALLVASPVIALNLAHRYVPPADVDLWYKVNRFRSWFHVFPLAFSVSAWASLLGAMVLIGFGRWMGGAVGPLRREFIRAWLWAIVVAVAGALVAAYGVKIPQLVSLQLAKAVDLLIAPGVVLAVSAWSSWLEEVLQRNDVVRSVVAGTLWSASVTYWSWSAHPKVSLLLVGIVVLGVGAAFQLRLPQRGDRLRVGQQMIATALGVALVAGCARQVQTAGVRWRQAAASPQYPFAQWALQNTPKDAVFLVPPGMQEDWQSFRAISRRGVFVTWKDGTHVLFDPRYTQEWVSRIAEIGFDIRKHELRLRGSPPVNETNINSLYFKLQDEDVARMASRYRIDYWIVPVDKPSRFREVFRHGKWKVLQVRTRVEREIIPTSQPRRDSHR